MIIYPAIDLKDGVCVRLLHGEMDQVTVYNEDPAKQARQFQTDHFSWIHLVDLNGAVAGHSVNRSAIENILQAVNIPVQLGGGIRQLSDIEFWLNKGVARVILGTAAVESPSLVREACQNFPGQIVVAIDARDGFVAVSGWQAATQRRALDLALEFEQSGVAAIIYTDINRDGGMAGINIDATLDLAFAVTTPIIASGGLASIKDLIELKRHESAGITGVVMGRALYDGRIDPKEALKVANT